MSDLHDHDSAPNAPARPAILTVDDDPLETSTPGLFSPGDVRLDWMKRVVPAVGEGARRGHRAPHRGGASRRLDLGGVGPGRTLMRVRIPTRAAASTARTAS